jgi:hypothetical protein
MMSIVDAYPRRAYAMINSEDGGRSMASERSTRRKIPEALRSEVLMANRHLCCVCQKGWLQVHHINGDNSDNRAENLAVLCLEHHDMATAPKGLTARLKTEEILQYKRGHEAACAVHAHKIARGRTAFFMVDYKNVERIYQLYGQLTEFERIRAVQILTDELQEEEVLRQKQGFSCSIEPTMQWNETTRTFLELVRVGTVHPEVFSGVATHPVDSCLPSQFPHKGWHDIWVQILMRVLLTCRPALPIEDAMKLDTTAESGFLGRLVTLNGRTRGKHFQHTDFEKLPLTRTTVLLESDEAVWRGILDIKTHYVYSSTAAHALAHGRTQGVVLIRDIRRMNMRGDKRVVNFTCSPLILGSGGGGPLQIP